MGVHLEHLVKDFLEIWARVTELVLKRLVVSNLIIDLSRESLYLLVVDKAKVFLGEIIEKSKDFDKLIIARNLKFTVTCSMVMFGGDWVA